MMLKWHTELTIKIISLVLNLYANVLFCHLFGFTKACVMYAIITSVTTMQGQVSTFKLFLHLFRTSHSTNCSPAQLFGTDTLTAVSFTSVSYHKILTSKTLPVSAFSKCCERLTHFCLTILRFSSTSLCLGKHWYPWFYAFFKYSMTLLPRLWRWSHFAFCIYQYHHLLLHALPSKTSMPEQTVFLAGLKDVL